MIKTSREAAGGRYLLAKSQRYMKSATLSAWRGQSALDLGTLTRNLIYQDTGATLNNPTSLAFDCSIAGQPLAHWIK